MEICPLCRACGNPFYRDIYFSCPECLCLFRPDGGHLSAEDEKKRYLEHNNDVNDSRYREFVSPVVQAVLRSYSPAHRGLDFGAGPGPVISSMLQEAGNSIRLYDPFFHDHPELLADRYDYIACCEVMEHFRDPEREFRLLKRMLLPGGTLFCMTSLYEDTIDFNGWNYKNDRTHVIIYRMKTLEWIRNRIGFSGLAVTGRLIEYRNGE